jgi:hypothetical protein
MSDYWFRPKQRGIGAGVPLNWKGWALFAAYIGTILAVPSIYEASLGYPGTPLLRILGVARSRCRTFSSPEKDRRRLLAARRTFP